MKIQRNFVSMSLTAGLMLGLVGGALSGARADEKHPHYLVALADLREARAFVTLGNESALAGHEADVVANIDRAIADIKRAAIDDGKGMDDHAAIDANLKHKGRLHKADALLDAARKNLNYREDDKVALGWRKEAMRHVNDADKADKQAMKELRNDS